MPEDEKGQALQYVQAGEYERTMAVLSSAAGTRTTIVNKGNGKALGCYDPRGDRIYLFPFVEHIPGSAVALEEAGHSLHQKEYIRHEKDSLKWLEDVRKVVGDKLADFVSGWTQWADDARIYYEQTKTFPRAEELFRQVFLLRYKHYGTTLAAKATDEYETAACEVYKDIALRYLMGERFPTTYKGILDLGYSYLKDWKKRVQEAKEQREQGQGQPQEEKQEGSQGQGSGQGQPSQEKGTSKGQTDEQGQDEQKQGPGQGEQDEPQGQDEKDEQGPGKAKGPSKEDVDREAAKVPSLPGGGAGNEAGLQGIKVTVGIETDRVREQAERAEPWSGLRNLKSSNDWEKLEEVLISDEN